MKLCALLAVAAEGVAQTTSLQTPSMRELKEASCIACFVRPLAFGMLRDGYGAAAA
jgi:hypothetical protein